MGDVALSIRPVNAVILDEYGRAYDIDLAHGLQATTPRLRLTPALISQGRSVSVSAGSADLAFSISGDDSGGARVAPLLLTDAQQNQSRILAGRISAALAKDTRFSLGIRQAAAGQVAALQGMQGGAFLTANEARCESGFEAVADNSFALRQSIAGFGLTGSAEIGDARLFERAGAEFIRSGTRRYPYSVVGLSLDRQIGPAKLAIGANWMREDETILGARFADFIGRNGARSLFVDGNGEIRLGRDWMLGASWRQGWTYANGSASLTSQRMLKSNAFSFDIARSNAFASGDRLAFRIAQPLRVSSGGLALNVPVAYNYSTLTPTFGVRRFSLASSGARLPAK